MKLLQITQFSEPKPVTVFRLQERISLDNFAELENITKDLYNDGMRNLVLDLGETPSISSIGVRAIVVIHKILAANGGNPLKLAVVPQSIREVLNIAGITQFIEIYDTVEAAVTSF